MAPRSEGSILLTGGGFGVDPTPSFIAISVAEAGLRAAAEALFEPMKGKGLQVASATVSTLVSAGCDKACEVAEAFWHPHAQPRSKWDRVVVMR